MPNEYNEELDNQNQEANTQNPENPTPAEENFTPQNWEEAFAAVEQNAATATRPATIADQPDDSTGEAGATPPADGAGAQPNDADLDDADLGGPLFPDDGDDDSGGPAYTEADIERTVQELQSRVEERAVQETAELMLTRTDPNGNPVVRSSNGVLGATINDPDIYRRDENGVPQFFNPDTGRPFTGDNPRAQAKQWVEDYNEEMRDAFNQIAQRRMEELEQEVAPAIALAKFTPTYDALDPVRQSMLDGIIGDYEVFDSKGKHIGYSCDLDKALAQVNRQVSNIKAQREAQRAATGVSGASNEIHAGQGVATPAQSVPSAGEIPPSGPAMDMKVGASTDSGVKPSEFKSLAEAMEYEQSKQLEALRQKGRK